MLKRAEIAKLDDFFTERGNRRDQGGYFYRINGYSPEIRGFIRRYYEAARSCGVIIEGGLKNPDSANLSYYNEMMGGDFQMTPEFIDSSLVKWLPRLDARARDLVAQAVYSTLDDLRKSGKTGGMLRNAYIKFMCWLYYRFEGVVSQLGSEQIPRILYEGEPGNYELLLLNVLFLAGCDIVLLQYRGDAGYRALDPASAKSCELSLPGMTAFPESFSLKQIRQDIQEELELERISGEKPRLAPCTNAWISGKPLDDLRKDPAARLEAPEFFSNCFFRIAGAEDRVTYLNDLYRLRQDLLAAGRKVVIADTGIAPPTSEEIAAVTRGDSRNIRELVAGLLPNLSFLTGELRRIARKAFTELMLEESRREENLSRLTSRGVYLICWLRRFHRDLFGTGEPLAVGCFFHMGACRYGPEALFCRFLARLPADVVIFCPDLRQKCCLQDPLLYEVRYEESLEVTAYPEAETGISMGTAAYHAERDLDSALFEDTGIYRNQQYSSAVPLFLKTMYEEIPVLWDQELKFRPNFSVRDGTVTLPVLFAVINGVKDGNVPAYWDGIRKLITPDTAVIRGFPYLSGSASGADNPVKPFATEFFKNGRLQKSLIKSHRAYQYGFLREPVQDYILDCLQRLIDQKLIRGTFENGMEYTVIAVALNLEKNILRLIQRFDFTRKNPKLICLVTGETAPSLEDDILVAFLSQIGFDVLFFVPTGYQCAERHFSRSLAVPHEIGEYVFDLEAPGFVAAQSDANKRSSWLDSIFKWRK